MESEQRKLRVAIYTNVLLSGVIWPRWPHAVLQHALHGDYQLVIPEIVIMEAERHVKRRFPEFQPDFEMFLALVDCERVPLPTPEEVRSALTLMRQAEDVPVALSVIAACVDCFVTLDKDFTDLHPSTQRVRDAMPPIMLPAVFLREIMNWTSEQLEAVRNRAWSD